MIFHTRTTEQLPSPPSSQSTSSSGSSRVTAAMFQAGCRLSGAAAASAGTPHQARPTCMRTLSPAARGWTAPLRSRTCGHYMQVARHTVWQTVQHAGAGDQCMQAARWRHAAADGPLWHSQAQIVHMARRKTKTCGCTPSNTFSGQQVARPPAGRLLHLAVRAEMSAYSS